MKTILLIVAMMGFVTVNSYGQTKSCACKKAHHHHTTAYHKTTTANTSACQPSASGTWSRSYSFTGNEQPCFQYRQHNILVTQCPGTFYDNSDIHGNGTGYETESSFMGNYPAQDGTNINSTTVQCVPQPMAPQHTTIDHYNGVAPAGGNGCNYDCTSK